MVSTVGFWSIIDRFFSKNKLVLHGVVMFLWVIRQDA